MEYLPLVIWICLWPISCTLTGYFINKEKRERGEPLSERSETADNVEVLIWIVVAFLVCPS